jgi:hypothetical protein
MELHCASTGDRSSGARMSRPFDGEDAATTARGLSAGVSRQSPVDARSNRNDQTASKEVRSSKSYNP